MAPSSPFRQEAQLARQTRERFAEQVSGVFDELASSVGERLQLLAEQPGGAREMQDHRDAVMAYRSHAADWVEGLHKAWRRTLAEVAPAVSESESRLPVESSTKFELLADEAVEDKILASRLTLALLDKLSWELNDLRLRMQSLEDTDELAPNDLLRPDVLARLVLERWLLAELSRDTWSRVQDVVAPLLAERLVEACHDANAFLVQRGVMPEIDLKPLVRRAVSSGMPAAAAALSVRRGGGAGADGPADAGGGGTGGGGVSRMRERAQGVVGQLRRMLGERVPDFERTRATQPSPLLSQALAEAELEDAAEGLDPSEGWDVQGEAGVAEAMERIRSRTTALKSRAATGNEKATVEIVALMFQSILAEERIPSTVRVWFARLQIPVLRVAIAEPEFFGSLQHPARMLIDRMGACVLGFDASAIGGSALEAEIRRVVQVIEQYPETGRRVFQLVHDEFQKFLQRYLSEVGAAQRISTVAQQVEQKETAAIQYTIEMRNMLTAMPVREEIREYLFKVWSEVLAVAAVKYGPQHEETLSLKAVATDLVWAASAKPNRADRNRVISNLPTLLQKLRTGMDLLGLPSVAQGLHIKTISDTLADAFHSRTEAIPQAQIDDMAKRLAHLEDFVSDDGLGDLPLDAESLQVMLGLDSAEIDIIADGGVQPDDAGMAWAQELTVGSWFQLDHNGAVSQVQYAWRSDRGQLHLFAARDGRSYLIQLRRLAAYLQAQLLVPAEEEALTVRATREALTKLDANPERLLS